MGGGGLDLFRVHKASTPGGGSFKKTTSRIASTRHGNGARWTVVASRPASPRRRRCCSAPRPRPTSRRRSRSTCRRARRGLRACTAACGTKSCLSNWRMASCHHMAKLLVRNVLLVVAVGHTAATPDEHAATLDADNAYASHDVELRRLTSTPRRSTLTTRRTTSAQHLATSAHAHDRRAPAACGAFAAPRRGDLCVLCGAATRRPLAALSLLHVAVIYVCCGAAPHHMRALCSRSPPHCCRFSACRAAPPRARCTLLGSNLRRRETIRWPPNG